MHKEAKTFNVYMNSKHFLYECILHKKIWQEIRISNFEVELLRVLMLNVVNMDLMMMLCIDQQYVKLVTLIELTSIQMLSRNLQINQDKFQGKQTYV